MPNSPDAHSIPEIYFVSSDYDALATRLKPADFRGEAALYRSKWYDYRLMHPVQATYLFAEEYVKAARNYYRRTRDMRAAPYIKPYAGKDLFVTYPEPEPKVKRDGTLKKGKSPNVKPAVLKSIWRARQQADKMGIPYDFYCNAIMRMAVEHKWQRVPVAQMLIGKKAVTTDAQRQYGFEAISAVDFVAKCWVEHCKTRIVHSSLMHYLIENDAGYPEQFEHRAFVMTQIANKSSPEFSLGYAIGQKVVKIEECEKVFGSSLVKNSMQYAFY